MNLESEPKFDPPELLRLGDSIAILPVIHGSGQFALTVRRWMLEQDFDCVAVPLPESFRESTESAILDLPRPSVVIQQPAVSFKQPDFESGFTPYGADSEDESDDDGDYDSDPASYVPIDPCQPVIMAIRAAMGEHIPRASWIWKPIPSCHFPR